MLRNLKQNLKSGKANLGMQERKKIIKEHGTRKSNRGTHDAKAFQERAPISEFNLKIQKGSKNGTWTFDN